MLDQELLDDVLEALEQAGSPEKNSVLRQALGWEESAYGVYLQQRGSLLIVLLAGKNKSTQGKDSR